VAITIKSTKQDTGISNRKGENTIERLQNQNGQPNKLEFLKKENKTFLRKSIALPRDFPSLIREHLSTTPTHDNLQPNKTHNLNHTPVHKATSEDRHQ